MHVQWLGRIVASACLLGSSAPCVLGTTQNAQIRFKYACWGCCCTCVRHYSQRAIAQGAAMHVQWLGRIVASACHLGSSAPGVHWAQLKIRRSDSNMLAVGVASHVYGTTASVPPPRAQPTRSLDAAERSDLIADLCCGVQEYTQCN